MDYLDKFKLTDKNVFVVGGMGLIGTDIVLSLCEAGANVTIIDVVEGNVLNVNYEYFDITKLENINSFLRLLTEKYGKICFL